MSVRASCRILGILLLILSLSMGLALGWSLYEIFIEYKPHSGVFSALGAGILIGILLSLTLIFAGTKNDIALGKRESFFIVSGVWILGAGIGAVPFYLWARFSGNDGHPFSQFINCYFEAMSGLTTTGASLLDQIPELPRGLLFWRAFIQWLGGLGIVVLFVAVMPLMAVDNKKIFQAETSSIGKSQDTPSLHDMAQILWGIYGSLTLLQVLLMKVADPSLSWFTCITFGFSTAATAGFSIFSESAGSLSAPVQWVVILFMFLAGINYTLFYQILKGRFRPVLQNIELRSYIGVLLVSSLVVGAAIAGTKYPSMSGKIMDKADFFRSLLDATFQVVSIHTSTGFSNVDFNEWPDTARFVLILLMFVGGCSGSTGGGIKVIRFVALFKMLAAEVERSFRPNIIRPCLVQGLPLSGHQQHSILLHVLFVCGLIAASTLLLFLFENGKPDLLTAFTASLASVNNIGPGFSLVGASANYVWLSPPSKLLLAFLMVVGRLEIFTVLSLLSRRFWSF